MFMGQIDSNQLHRQRWRKMQVHKQAHKTKLMTTQILCIYKTDFEKLSRLEIHSTYVTENVL